MILWSRIVAIFQHEVFRCPRDDSLRFDLVEEVGRALRDGFSLSQPQLAVAAVLERDHLVRHENMLPEVVVNHIVQKRDEYHACCAAESKTNR